MSNMTIVGVVIAALCLWTGMGCMAYALSLWAAPYHYPNHLPIFLGAMMTAGPMALLTVSIMVIHKKITGYEGT